MSQDAGKNNKNSNKHNREMESRQVERDSKNFNQSVNASNDKYMVDALSKVRESDITHPESLTRMNGSWMHNRSFKK